MKTFTTVEDYLEVIAGFREPNSGLLNPLWIFGSIPTISLARYDVDVVINMATASCSGQPLTERQATLACKIISTYTRQLAKHGIDVTPVNNPVYRLPLRILDYRQLVYQEGSLIYVRFQYNSQLIDQFRKFSKDSQGLANWDVANKCWAVDITEYNVNWVYEWATANNFEISPEVTAMNDSIRACEQTPYAIELVMVNSVLSITNAADSLNEYITEHMGGFRPDNILRLMDASATLGYTVSDELVSAARETYSNQYCDLMVNRELRVIPDTESSSSDMDTVLDYADSVQRWPVVCFEPDMSGAMANRLNERYPAEQFSMQTNGREVVITDKTRYIHATKGITSLACIPLLITTAGMIFGGDRQMMIQNSEKIVYCAQEVYTKGHTTKKVKQIVS